jgi:glycine cleavage system H protein
MSKFKLDADARYAKTHEWMRMEGDLVVVGISDAAQDMLSDVVYIELPAEGATVKAGEKAAVVESVKAAEDVLSPVSGVVVAINEELVSTPEIVNSDPYTAWFYKVEPSALDAEMADLMDSDEYDVFVDETAH